MSALLRFAGGLLGGVGALWLLWIVARIWGDLL